MIEEFIRNRGATILPGFGDPKLSAMNAERERSQALLLRANHWSKRKAARCAKAAST